MLYTYICHIILWVRQQFRVREDLYPKNAVKNEPSEMNWIPSIQCLPLRGWKSLLFSWASFACCVIIVSFTYVISKISLIKKILDEIWLCIEFTLVCYSSTLTSVLYGYAQHCLTIWMCYFFSLRCLLPCKYSDIVCLYVIPMLFIVSYMHACGFQWCISINTVGFWK